MKQQRTLASDTIKKRKILIGCAIGGTAILMTGAGVGIGYAIWHTRKPKSNIPADAFSINNAVDSKYLVSPNKTIWCKNNSSYNQHNTLFNLALFIKEKSVSTNNFVIDGVVNFGIMIGFDQNISLFANDNSLMDITSEYESFGVISAQLENPDSNDYYKGRCYIDNTVYCNVYTNGDNANGAFFSNVDVTGVIDIRGTFVVRSIDRDAYGVIISEDKGTVDISGVFIVYSNYQSCGVYFLHTTSVSNLIISGVFTVFNCSEGMAVGVLFSIASGRIDISGTFTVVSSDDSSGGKATGVFFEQRLVDENISIDGVFTISCDNMVYGVDFEKPLDRAQNISGIFTLNSNGIVSGVSFPEASGEQQFATPIFYSNKEDASNWTLKGKEQWNGILCSVPSETRRDDSLTIRSIYGTKYENKVNSWIDAIDTASNSNKKKFNKVLKNKLKNMVKNLKAPNVATAWLKNIIKQI